MERGVIYTAITGGKDRLIDPTHVLSNVAYVCFTDDPSLQSNVWTIRLLASESSDPARNSKRAKLLPHAYLEHYSWSLWIDGNIAITGDIGPMIYDHLDKGLFFAWRHFKRTCAYQEAEACIRRLKDREDVLLAQHQRYRREGMPENLPMTANLMLLRRHENLKVISAMEKWWAEVQRGSRRDQMSLPYVLWQTRLPWDFFYKGEKPDWYEQPYFKRLPHAVHGSPFVY